MSIWGKVVGGFGGLLVGGPIGALLGATAGHVYDKKRGADGELPPFLQALTNKLGQAKETARQTAFTTAVVALSAKMAKADGVVTRAEIDTFKRIFRIPPGQMRNVGLLFDMAKKDPSGYEIYARQVAMLFRDNPAILEELLDALFEIAKADGPPRPAQLDFLHRVGRIFGLEDHDYARVRAAHTGEPDPYTVLGLSPQASNDEIKAAWRRLTRENHPDSLIAQGMPEEFIEVATRKMAAINAAYDSIARQRGIG
ncbi:TerB family tellurite resistance protein [Telmatospirillum sp. J64-1]|uniref:TerB family tellurite resistance protein n=1 Tax=Telmatospirillum sp. J64-1 TaxID=2502183 RepID=UPI00115CECE6|nr:TerB family tellurite resistance protein [Telmatospirillum sp. J64-1]